MNVFNRAASKRLMTGMLLAAASAGFLSAPAFGATPPKINSLVAMGRYSEAEAYFMQELKSHPSDASVYASLAKLYLFEGKIEASIKYAKKATNLAPKQANYWVLAAVAYKKKLRGTAVPSKSEVARNTLRALNKAVSLSPKNSEAHFLLAEYYTLAPSSVGGDMAKASQQIAILRELAPARAEIALAVRASHEQHLKSAEQHFRAAAKLDSSAMGEYRLGVFLMQDKRYDEAVKAFTHGISKHPKFSPNYYELGRTAVVSKSHVKEGISALKHYLSMPHHNWMLSVPYKWVHYRLGALYGIVEDSKNEILQYRLALKRDPHFIQAKQALVKALKKNQKK